MKNKTELILNSAEELMCGMSDPVKDITVDMIAKNAGIGKGSIYYYFKSKEDIIDAVIERSYSTAIHDYFESVSRHTSAIEKLKTLFRSILAKEFRNSSRNIIVTLHVHEDLLLRHKMMMTAIRTVSPILTGLLAEGQAEGSVHTDAPKESAEMIVALLTFLLDSSFFPADAEGIYRKLRLYASVLENSLKAEKGSFDFIFMPLDD